MIDYIPYKLATEIADISDPNLTLDCLEPLFMDKREFNKQRACKKILRQIPISSSMTGIKLEVINSGFTLELPNSSLSNCLIIHHPDFPSTQYQVVKYINLDNYINFMSLLQETGEIRGRKLIGTYYFDPDINFFRLENKMDKERIKKFNIGRVLNGTWKKLIPGHKYYIEVNVGYKELKEVVFLGIIKDTKTLRYGYRSRPIPNYLSGYLDKNVLSTLEAKKVDQAYLFKDLEKDPGEDNYFIYDKPNIRGVDLGNTGETVSEIEFYDMAVNNGWTFYINDVNKFKEIYSKQLIQYIDEHSLLFNPSYYLSQYSFDLSKDTIDKVISMLNKLVGNHSYRYNDEFSLFTSVISPYHYNFDISVLVDILHIIYSHYGLNEN